MQNLSAKRGGANKNGVLNRYIYIPVYLEIHNYSPKKKKGATLYKNNVFHTSFAVNTSAYV